MNFKLWSLFVVGCLTLCISCSGDEPKVDISIDEPVTEPIEQTESITMDLLTEKSWSGRYFIEYKDGRADYQRIEIVFNGQDEQLGSGKMTVSDHNSSSEYKFDFKISGDSVVCNALKIATNEEEHDGNVLFRLKDNLLYLDSPVFEPVILGQNDEIFSDATGILKTNLRNLYEKIRRIWLHENEMNILYWSDARVYQLTKPRSKEYNYYDSQWGPLYDYEEVSENMTIRFEGWIRTLSWKLKLVTDNVLVLQDDINEDVKIVDVFYSASEEVLPKHVKMNYHDLYWANFPWCIGG